MGIDNIGKKGGVGTPAQPPDVGRAEKGAGGFEVRTDKSDASQAAKIAAPTNVERSPLEQLRAGEIDIQKYLDLKVEHATSSLKGLSDVEMKAVREMLRDKLVSDPALSDLVKHATGVTPPSDE